MTPGIVNFRDIGGCATRDGGVVATGVIYRSGALDGMSADDSATYAALRIQTVLDLRSDTECARRPGLPGSRHIALSGPPAAGHPPRTAAEGVRRLRDVYCGVLDHASGGIGMVFRAIAAPGALPAVVHCHAGKDRTGVVVALLLELVGVERTIVLDEYARSAPLGRDDDDSYQRMIANGYGEAAASAMLAPSRRALREALEHLDRDWGGTERYLVEAAGVDPGTLRVVRDRLVAHTDAATLLSLQG